MKLSFVTLATPELAAEDAVKIAGKYGVGVDLRCGGKQAEDNLSPNPADASNAKVTAALAETGAELASIFCYPRTLPADYDTSGTVSDILEELKLAAFLGAKAVRIFVGDPNTHGDSAKYLDAYRNAVLKILSEDNSGIPMFIQNHAGNIDTVDAIKLVRFVNSPRLRVAYSPDHENGDKAYFAKLAADVFPYAGQVYIADRKAADGQRQLTELGEGDIPLKETISYFEANGFTGFYTLKWERLYRRELAGIDIALPRFIEFMK